MNDKDSVTKNLNAFITMLSHWLSIDINISNEYKCFSLFCPLLDSWDSIILAIGSNATTLSFDEIVSSLFLKEPRRKYMESQNVEALFVRGCS